jgi:hypothetical protein
MSALEHSEDMRRALAHIRGRTQQGSFAAPLYDWSPERWAAAVEPLEQAGMVESATARSADDPAVSRGWTLAQSVQKMTVEHALEEMGRRSAREAQRERELPSHGDEAERANSWVDTQREQEREDDRALRSANPVRLDAVREQERVDVDFGLER